jgi:predicted transcriptional regulator
MVRRKNLHNGTSGKAGGCVKAVLISIRPKWCELIANGEKTVEIRKTRPKIDFPFKCYIYCTKPKWPHEDFITVFDEQRNFYAGGMVIGEFLCDDIRDAREIHASETCLNLEEWLKYTEGHKKTVWGWSILSPKIYDKPKLLREFRQCHRCPYMGACNDQCWNPLQRPPQSWCYVEELE